MQSTDAGPACGTPRGYLAHLHYGQTIDEACRSAWRVFNAKKPKPEPQLPAEGRKRCTKCGKFKAVMDFAANGKGNVRSWCKVCKNAYNREHNERQRQLREQGLLPPRQHRPRIPPSRAVGRVDGRDHQRAGDVAGAVPRGDREAA